MGKSLSTSFHILLLLTLLLILPFLIVISQREIAHRRSRAAALPGQAEYTFSPARVNVPQGQQSQSLTLRLDTAGARVNFAKAVITFDRAKLNLASSVTPILTTGRMIENTSVSAANLNGRIVFTWGVNPGTVAPGSSVFNFASIPFTVVSTQTNDPTQVRVDLAASQVVNSSEVDLAEIYQPANLTLNYLPAATGTPTPTPRSMPTPTSAPGGSVTLYSIADTDVRADLPDTNFGARANNTADGGPIRISYIKFDLAALAGRTLTNARFRIYITDPSAGTENVKGVANTSWSETTLTYNSRSSFPLGSTIATLSNTQTGAWQDVDVTSFVQGKQGQLVAFGIDTGSDDGIFFNAKEAVNDPQLVVQYGGGTGPTPTMAPTSAVTSTPRPTATPTVTPRPTATPSPRPTGGVTLTPSPVPTSPPSACSFDNLNAVPGTVQMENYTCGGQATDQYNKNTGAYYDNSSGNSGGAYRTNEWVDIEAIPSTTNQYNLGWTRSGEWIKYKFSVSSPGIYNLTARLASNATSGRFRVQVDGVDISGQKVVPYTGGWYVFTNVPVGSVNISTSGVHEMVLNIEGSYGNYDYINFVRQ